MVTAQSFHRQNAATAEQLSRFANAAFTSVLTPNVRVKMVARSTGGASNWLRVKTAVSRIVVFRVAVLVQRPGLHCGIGPVVRQGKYDRVARTAICTVDVGIPVA